MLMTQQRFKVTANGFVELNGSITVQLSKDTVFGVNPELHKTTIHLVVMAKQEDVNYLKLNTNYRLAFILFRYMQWHLFNFLQQHLTMLNGQMKLWQL